MSGEQTIHTHTRQPEGTAGVRRKVSLSWLPFTTLDRYIMRNIMYSYVVFLSVMLSMYVVLDLFANFDEFAQTSEGMRDLLNRISNYYGYYIFLYFAQIAGLITVVSAAITLARLQRNNELVATLAGGISMRRLLLPVILIAIGLNVLWALDQEVVIPRIAHRLVLSHEEATGKKPFHIWFLRDKNNALLSTGHYDPATQTMYDVIILEREQVQRGSGMVKTISGKLTADRATWDESRQAWELRRGRRSSRSSGTEGFEVAGTLKDERVEYYESEWGPRDLLLRQSGSWTALLSLSQIQALINKKDLMPNVQQLVAAKHVRFTTPLVNILLIFLGIPFFLNRSNQNVLLSVGMSLLVCLLCFMMSFICQQLAGTTAHSALVAWLPIMIFTPVAAILVDSIRT